MAESLQIGAHWALIAIDPDAGNEARWVGRWALYESFSMAMHAGEPGHGRFAVLGRTASFPEFEEARRSAEHDAARSEAVLSQTYRD